MYKGTLEARSTPELLDVLMVAHKFRVKSCVNYCTHALQKSPMTIESASLYLQLPSIVHTNTVPGLKDAAKRFLIQCFEHIENDQLLLEEELLNLPLSVMEVVLSSDELPVTNEDVVYDFAIKWGRNHYPEDERRQVLSNKLCRLIRFQNMSLQKLREALQSTDLDNMCTTQAVIEALFLKTEAPHNIVRFNRRAYQQKPLTVTEYDTPHPHCMAVWNLHTDDCQVLKDRPAIYFQDFMFEGLKFQGLACRNFNMYEFTIDFHIFYPERGEDDYNGGQLDDNIVNAQVGDTQNSGRIVMELEVMSKEYRVFLKQYMVAFPMNRLFQGVYRASSVYGPQITSQFYINDIIYFRLWVTLAIRDGI
eukprot:PITA_05647